MGNKMVMKKTRKAKNNGRAKTGLAVLALCLLAFAGCGSDTAEAPQSFSSREADEAETGTAQADSNSATSYTLEDAEALLGEADAQGSIEELTQDGCLFAPYTVLEDSTMMVSQTEDATENLEEVKADGNTEYVVVNIDAGAGTATSVLNGDKSSLKEGNSIYIHGEPGADGIWTAEKIVVTVMD